MAAAIPVCCSFCASHFDLSIIIDFEPRILHVQNKSANEISHKTIDNENRTVSVRRYKTGTNRNFHQFLVYFCIIVGLI